MYYPLGSLFLFVLGSAIGSFLNVVIDRIPREESLNGRSHCDHCKKTLAPLDLVPVFSYVLLGGKCRYCGKRLSVQYPLIEALTGGLFVLVFLMIRPVFDAGLFFLLAIVSVMTAVFFTDLKEQLIPDELQISFFLIALAEKIVNGASLIDIGYAIAAGLSVAIPILLMYLFTKGRGMGFGDVKLAFNIGFYLGWVSGLLVLYIGFVSGAIVGIALLVAGRKKMKSRIAFGPFLVLGLFAMLLFRHEVLAVIRRIYGF